MGMPFAVREKKNKECSFDEHCTEAGTIPITNIGKDAHYRERVRTYSLKVHQVCNHPNPTNIRGCSLSVRL